MLYNNSPKDADKPKAKTKEFVMEDFGGNVNKLPAYEILSFVEKGYKDNGKKHYEYPDYIEESREVLDKAKGEAETAVRSGFDKGYQDGLKKAYQEVEADMKAKTEEFTSQLNGILDSVESFWSGMLVQNYENLMHLIVEAVKVVICGEVKTNQEVILNVMKKVFDKVESLQEVRIFLNPEDIETIKLHKSDVMEIIGKKKKVHVQTDAEIMRGGCRVEMKNQGIEAGIDTMVKEMEKKLLLEFT